MNKRIKNDRKGSVLVEAALTLPILMLLMMGVFEFGNIIRIQQALTNAAREGARVAAVDINDATALSSAQTVAQNYLTASGVDLSLVTISPTAAVVAGNPAVRVAVSFTYTINFLTFVPGFSPNFQLNSQVTMRREA
jgi:Flp pilus assembly protein TadG